MNKLYVAEMRDLEKQVSIGEISYSRMVEIINEKFTTENARLREAERVALKSVPSDVLELLRIIARSDDAMYREEARRLIRRYCN